MEWMDGMEWMDAPPLIIIISVWSSEEACVVSSKKIALVRIKKCVVKNGKKNTWRKETKKGPTKTKVHT